MTIRPLEDAAPNALQDTAMDNGNKLREARIRAGFSEQDVAKQLRLDSDTIRYLEEENYERLPAPAFVRGYLRNYASLLGMPPDPIVQAFNCRGLPPPPLKADITQSQAVTASRSPIRIASYGVLFCVAILTAVHLYGQNSKTEKAQPASGDHAERSLTESHATAARAAADLAAPEQTASAISVQDVTRNYSEQRITGTPKLTSHGNDASERNVDTAAAPQTETEVPRFADKTALISPPLSEQDPTSLSAGLGNPAAVVDHPTTQVSPPVVKQEATVNSETPAQSHLAMRFAHDSWVEIYDDAGTRLHYSLVKRGEALALTGTAPFRVLLGYAKDVDIEYNGRPFDHRSFIHPQGLARFTLGERPELPDYSDRGAGTLPPTSGQDHATIRRSATAAP